MKGCSWKIVCRTRPNKYGLHPLLIQFFIDGKKGEHGLNIAIPLKLWNDKSQQMFTKDNEVYKNYNLIIEQERTAFNNILVDLTINKIVINKEIIYTMLKSKGSREDFLIYFEKKYLERWNDEHIEPRTKDGHKAICEKCKKFKGSWLFTEINNDFLKDFDIWHLKYLKKNAEKNGKPLKNDGISTAQKAFAVIRTYIKLALKDKIKFEEPKISVNYPKTTRAFCDQDELLGMIEKYNSDFFSYDPALEGALEKFLFSCATGLRVSDLKRIKTTDITDNYFHFIPYKGRKKPKAIDIPITRFIKKIIGNRTGNVFDKFTEQVVNRKLKDVADRCGIEKELSLNVGRHTFATLFLQKGGDIKSLQEIMGHADIKTTQNYLHKDLSQMKREMDKSIGAFFDNAEKPKRILKMKVIKRAL